MRIGFPFGEEYVLFSPGGFKGNLPLREVCLIFCQVFLIFGLKGLKQMEVGGRGWLAFIWVWGRKKLGKPKNACECSFCHPPGSAQTLFPKGMSSFCRLCTSMLVGERVAVSGVVEAK